MKLIWGILMNLTICMAVSATVVPVDWAEFLGRQDPVWNQMPSQWYEAPFLGNGMMGTMVRQTGERSVRWDVGRGDVQDHRSGGPAVLSRSRLPIGYFELQTVGKITGGKMRLDLWNAVARGEIQTDRGTIRWRSFVPSGHMVIVTQINPSEGERKCRWEWNALQADSPRHTVKNTEGYVSNPPSRETMYENIDVCIQPLLEGGETATAWIESRKNNQCTLLISVGHSFPGNNARQDAVQMLKDVQKTSLNELLKAHQEWWHAYYPDSFVSIPDPYWESFYWIQMYKLASATRSDGMLIDNQGPWLQPTPWPAVWWNLNVQLTYWPVYGSNRLELGESLLRALTENIDALIQAVPEKYRYDSAGVARATGQDLTADITDFEGENAPEIGCLLWACHNVWLHYRHAMDDEMLRRDLFPLLKRAVNYYLHFVTKDRKGRLHLPKTYSPEYPDAGPDCNFDLSLLRWGCATLVEICQRLEIEDPLMPRWNGVVNHLADYPTDENGFMIARGVPFAEGHRHFSHLLMLYPLYLVNAEQEGAKKLAMKSVRHWQSLGHQAGYSLTGASSISSAFGLGNDALDYLNGLKRFIRPNTLYREAGPVIETPLSAAQCIHDMLLQSWGGTIRVFPAAPDAWKDVAFRNLRAQGAFLVSATRRDGKTEFVRIKSLAGEPCIISPGLTGAVRVSGAQKFKLAGIKPGVYSLDLKKGEEALLWSGGKIPDLDIQPVETDEKGHNPFGLK